MASLSFYIPGFYGEASVEVIKSIRRFYPNSSINISSDSGPNYYDASKEYNCNFQYYDTHIGYPVKPYGFSKEQALEFLKRFYIACLLSKETHIMCAEDDIAIIDEIPLEDDYEIYAHNTPNYVPQFVLDLCGQVSGVYPSRPYYGAGGGTIFKVSSFIENYFKIVHIFEQVYDQIRPNYPPFGYYDCFLTIFYYMSGKKYTINHGIYEIKPYKRDFDLTTLDSKKYPIVHLYKKHYPKEYGGFLW
jgi:hypothetical protein